MIKRTVLVSVFLLSCLCCAEIFADEKQPAKASVTNESRIVVNMRITKSDGTTEDQLLRPGQTLELSLEAVNVKTSFPTKKQMSQLSEEERQQVSATLFPELHVTLTQSDGTVARVDDSFLGSGTPVLKPAVKLLEIPFQHRAANRKEKLRK